MIEHVSKRRKRREVGPKKGAGSAEGPRGGAAEIRSQRITSGGGRLLPLVLASLLCGCERSSGPGAAGATPRAQPSTLGESAPGGPPTSNPLPGAVPEAPADADGWVTLGKEVEPWLVLALEALAAKGRIDLDLPVAMHLPVLASPRSDVITPRQLMEHTAHLGARAYEDFLRANPGSDALKAQAFLVALGSDDTPGERPQWRRGHLDSMAWTLLALTGTQDLAGALSVALGDSVQMAQEGAPPITPIRGAVRVLATRDAEVREQWGRGR